MIDAGLFYGNKYYRRYRGNWKRLIDWLATTPIKAPIRVFNAFNRGSCGVGA